MARRLVEEARYIAVEEGDSSRAVVLHTLGRIPLRLLLAKTLELGRKEEPESMVVEGSCPGAGLHHSLAGPGRRTCLDLSAMWKARCGQWPLRYRSVREFQGWS
jgi:hypothetical protein